MIHQTPAQYFDGMDPRPHTGRLVFDETQRELHFYEKDESGIERFLLSVDKNHAFEIRSRSGGYVIEWREGNNHYSRMFALQDPAFVRLVRDRFLAHKNFFWRYATFVWSESLGRVAVALVLALALTGFAAWFFMQHSYKLMPVSWDVKIGEQAEPGLKDFGIACDSPQTVRDLKKLLPYFVPQKTAYSYEILIIQSNIENAFALPGGKLAFFSRTIENARNYAELAGILAHEVGHVENRHGMQQLSQYLTLRLILALAFGMADDATLLAGIADAGALLLLLKNSRSHEREADLYAARKLVETGISNKPIRDFFARIAREHRDELANIPDFMLTHPAGDERIAFFEKYETKSRAQLAQSAQKLPAEMRALLRRKPVLATACLATSTQETNPVTTEEE